MLEINPRERATISEIMKHPWISQNHITVKAVPKPVIRTKNRVGITYSDVDHAVVDSLKKLKFNEIEILTRLNDPTDEVSMLYTMYSEYNHGDRPVDKTESRPILKASKEKVKKVEKEEIIEPPIRGMSKAETWTKGEKKKFSDMFFAKLKKKNSVKKFLE